MLKFSVRAGFTMSEPEVRHVDEEPPPFLGRWRNVYAAVLCYLAALMAGLYFLTKVLGHA